MSTTATESAAADTPAPPAAPIAETAPAPSTFTPYQKLMIGVLAFLQFTIILDFMVISPLGAVLLRELHLSTSRFSAVVSAYAFSAAGSGFLAAGFADRFDRKRMLLFFYAGFLAGTLLCGLATSYQFLLMARIVTGLFGGVIGSIVFAIVADLFPFHQRGRVMGVVQSSFAASQVLGLPVGLYLSNRWNWHAPFLLIFALASVAGVFIAIYVRPIDGHLKLQRHENPLRHVIRSVFRRRYIIPFVTTTLLATGGYMLLPFGNTFNVNNLGIPYADTAHIYLVTGLCSMVAGPLLGRLSDRFGKYTLFCFGSALAVVLIFIYTHLGPTPLAKVIAINVVLFIGINSRIIAGTALMTAVPDAPSRGAFMAVNASLSQVAGGVAAAAAGLIVVQTAAGPLAHYDVLGYVVSSSVAVTVLMMYFIDRMVRVRA